MALATCSCEHVNAKATASAPLVEAAKMLQAVALEHLKAS
jgi:hypothetical protein